MKYCPKCGTQLADSAAFCTKCGYKFKISEEEHRSTTLNDNPNKLSNNQPISVSNKKSNHGTLWGIIMLLTLIIVTSFAVWSQTPSYRDMHTSDKEKVSELITWSNKHDIILGVDVSIDGSDIILDPRDDSNFANYYHYYLYYDDTDDSDKELKHEILKLSEHVTKMWGNKYTVKILNPDNSDRYLMEAKDDEITYNVFE
ncbi:zinc-ribbon domain-containing protein [Companilactobacillus insicii]|uniref:zinc-ribbon domain-containing protein n=1 Tax=Companilactobacillus insicii TaxID=1732567 RepID=UPI000F772B2C|nr:zinc ribbon domain-containing protein [Companilactobacillus insicii]